MVLLKSDLRHIGSRPHLSESGFYACAGMCVWGGWRWGVAREFGEKSETRKARELQAIQNSKANSIICSSLQILIGSGGSTPVGCCSGTERCFMEQV